VQDVKGSIRDADTHFIRPVYLTELLDSHPLGLPEGLRLVFEMADNYKESKCPVFVRYETKKLKGITIIPNPDTPFYYFAKRLQLSLSESELQKIPNVAEYILNYSWLPPKDRIKYTKARILSPYDLFKDVANKYVLDHTLE